MTLIGEGADDAGGVFDEIMGEMVREIQQKLMCGLLIPTPNSIAETGNNRDAFLLNPKATTAEQSEQLKFLGILFGVAMRTRKPIEIELAPIMWKLLAGCQVTIEDLQQVDSCYVSILNNLLALDESVVNEENFKDLMPFNFNECQSANGESVSLTSKKNGTSHWVYVNLNTRDKYVAKVLSYRLNEFSLQIEKVREGMGCIVPLPIISLMTHTALEEYICGSKTVNVEALRKFVKYRGCDEETQVIVWFWNILESFEDEQKILFLRFVSGRSRLPANVNEMSQRFIIYFANDKTDALPTAQTCFFQIRLPGYSSQEVMKNKLLYAIKNCQTIDMDNHMLNRDPMRRVLRAAAMSNAFFNLEVNNANIFEQFPMPSIVDPSTPLSVPSPRAINVSSDTEEDVVVGSEQQSAELFNPSDQEPTSTARLRRTFHYQTLPSGD